MGVFGWFIFVVEFFHPPCCFILSSVPLLFYLHAVCSVLTLCRWFYVGFNLSFSNAHLRPLQSQQSTTSVPNVDWGERVNESKVANLASYLNNSLLKLTKAVVAHSYFNIPILLLHFHIQLERLFAEPFQFFQNSFVCVLFQQLAASPPSPERPTSVPAVRRGCILVSSFPRKHGKGKGVSL